MHTPTDPDAPPLRALHLRARLEPARPWVPPPTLGVTLRGALGAALFARDCTVDHRDCTVCPRATDCAVVPWFGPSALLGHTLRPYVLRAWGGPLVAPDRPLECELILLGPPPPALPALLEAMAQRGLGPARVPHRLVSLQELPSGQELLVEGLPPASLPRARPLVALVRPPPAAPTGARLHLLTPLDLGDADPSPAAVLRACIGRLRALARAQGIHLQRRWPDPEALPGRWIERRWTAGARWSERQDGEVPLSGWQGTLELGAGVEAFADLLAAVELTHVGRGVTAGLGWVAVEWLVGEGRPPAP